MGACCSRDVIAKPPKTIIPDPNDGTSSDYPQYDP